MCMVYKRTRIYIHTWDKMGLYYVLVGITLLHKTLRVNECHIKKIFLIISVGFDAELLCFIK